MRLLRVVMLAVLVAVVSGVSASAALTVAWPRENSIVRETVNVAVLASSVPSDSYVSFYLNDALMVAVGAASTISGNRQAFTWVWDTREPVNLGRPNDPPKIPEDGRYEIKIKAVRGDAVVDEAVVHVRLANKVTSISPDTPVTLRYEYRQGMSKKYAVRVGVSLAEVGGAAVVSPQEFQTFSYTGVASVEDVRGDGLALLRYRPVGNRLVIYGQNLGELPGFADGSIYQVVNELGNVVAADLFSTVGLRTSPALAVDFRVPLPRNRVRSGQTWSGTIGLSMPGLGEAMKLDSSIKLSGLEWAGGRECALIQSDFTGLTMLQVMAVDQQLGTTAFASASSQAGVEGMPQPQGGIFGGATNLLSGLGLGQMSSGPGGMSSTAQTSGTVKGTCSDWFAFRTGDLIRRQLTATVDARMDQSAVQRLNEGLGLASPDSPIDTGQPTPSGPAAYDQPEEYMEDMTRAMRGAFGSNRRTQDAGTQTTPVKFKITLTARLIN